MNSTLEKTTQAAQATIEQEIARHSRDIGIPAAQLKRWCINTGLNELKRKNFQIQTQQDRHELHINLTIETAVALQKLANQRGQFRDDLVIDVLTKAASKVELTAEDYLSIAGKVRATKAGAMPENSTIELDAPMVAKLRASLRAVKSNKTLENFLSANLQGMLEDNRGIFEGLIPEQHEHRRGEIEAKLKRIREGDKRLVRG